ncbi:Nudix [Glarea lozoyensis ATCC 20868]|uniref:Nudix n=1 Tax=Glarea lozoyensis (strain ATCC 20868 / MF5171) TaxID=1116229 RepID=S3DXU6_GLAL2|nr:Nudix [Glarea lozoyensis ATCC 20868]EPE31178.1 Nudix [Glarea lozoyensis ATCC 20868]
MKSLLDVVNEIDNFPYHGSKSYDQYVGRLWEFHLANDSRAHGYIPDFVVQAMPWNSDFRIDDSSDPRRVTLLKSSLTDANQAIADLLLSARGDKIFKCLNGWRNEEYRILGAKLDLKIERAGAGLFGITTTGVHMTVYTRSPDGEILLWVPKRSMTTKKNPGKLDSSVAGGVPAGVEPFECLVKEAAEEASLSPELTRLRAKATGCVMEYHVEDAGEGLLEPSVKFVYDMEIDRETVLQPADAEVEEFRLMTATEVQENIVAGNYKPMCVMVLIDFLIRHGILTIENEKDYSELVARTHRFLPFPLRPE